MNLNLLSIVKYFPVDTPTPPQVSLFTPVLPYNRKNEKKGNF